MSENRQRGEWLTGPVLVVGAGLLGTSVGLACRRSGLEVLLSDLAGEHVRTASGHSNSGARMYHVWLKPTSSPRLTSL